MAANPSVLQAIEYQAEASFGETSTSFASGARLPVINRPDIAAATAQSKMDVAIVRQRLNEGAQSIRGPMGGSLQLDFMLPGVGSTTAGAVPSSDMATFLGLVAGNTAQCAASGTTLTGGTTTVPTTTASGTFTAGALTRLGALGDGDGEGQAYAISSHTAQNLTVLNALAGAPANGAVMYTGRMVYPTEGGSTVGDVTGIRIGLRTANQQYILHGCYPTALSFTDLGPGQQPKVSVTLAVAWWEAANDTFPVSTAMQTHSGMIVAGGSLFVNAVGTATRVARSCRTFELNISMETIPLMGPGGVNAYQSIVGARRVTQGATVSWTEDAEAAGTNTPGALWDTDENSITNRHALYTLNTRDGASAAFYFPNLVQIGDKPTQQEANGLNVQPWRFRCDTGGTTTSALTLSCWRLGMF